MTVADVRGWFNTFGTGDKKTPKARMSGLFSFAVERAWVTRNFVEDMNIGRSTPKSIEIFSEIEGVFKTLINSEKYRPLVRPYAARAFGGPRKKESLDNRVREEDGMVIYPAGAAGKGGPARQHPASYAYLAWATWSNDQKLPVLSVTEFDKLDGEFRQEHGIKGQKKWHNWQRHTYASYMIPLLKNDLKELSEQMGNSPKVLKNHYLGNVVSKEVKLFWKLRPPTIP